MTDRVRESFDLAKEQGRIALLPFLTVGYPTVEVSIAVAKAIARAGADVVELGIPFSDPLAEGPTIQRSSHQALERGVTVQTCVEVVRELRTDGIETPLVFMGYYNPILAYGAERFCATAAGAGVDGLIVADLPTEEAAPLRRLASAEDLSLIPLLALTSSDQRIRAACQEASGFIYCVSTLGVTGTRERVSKRVRGLVSRVRKHTRLPAGVGFGISSRQHVAEVAEFADGAVVGSALIQLLSNGPVTQAPQRATQFIQDLRAGSAILARS